MRIAIVSDHLDPGNWGGAARVAAAQAKTFADQGHDILLTGASATGVTLSGFQHCHWPAVPGMRNAWRLRRETCRALRQFRPELLLTHQPLVTVLAAESAGLADIRYFFHSSWVDEVASRGKRGTRVRRRIEARALNLASHVFVTSEFTRTRLDYHHKVAAKIQETPLGVDSETHAVDKNARTKLCLKFNLSVDQPIIVCFRRLVPRTGIIRLLESMRDLDGVQLLIGGDGEARLDIESKLAEFNLESRVRLLGYVDETDRLLLLQGADVSVVPSLEYEGFGLASLESMACGTPVVATPVGNNPKLVNSVEGGIIAQSVDSAALSTAIKAAIDRDWDREALAARTTGRYSWLNHVELLLR